jgi:hypothetical protein
MQACLEMCINNVGAKGFVNTYTTVVLSLRARIITKRPLNIVLQQGVFLLKAMPGFFFFFFYQIAHYSKLENHLAVIL